MDWCRLHVGTHSDPKLSEVAMISGSTLERVAFVWMALLESASETEEAGRFVTNRNRIAALLRCQPDDIGKILDAMASEGIEMVAGDQILNWSKRQYASDSSTPRVRKYREKSGLTKADSGAKKGAKNVNPRGKGNTDETFQKRSTDVSETAEKRFSSVSETGCPVSETPPESESDTEIAKAKADPSPPTHTHTCAQEREEGLPDHQPANRRWAPDFLDRCLDAAGPAAAVLAVRPLPLEAWKGQGFTVEDVLAGISAVATRGGATARSWAYFDRAIAEARDARLTSRSGDSEAAGEPDDDGWKARLMTFRRRAKWSGLWGPEPGKPGCRCPLHLIEAFETGDAA